MIDERFVILGSMLAFVGSLSYLKDTIKGKTRPNRVSWFLWAAAPLIAFGAELSQGVGLPALMSFMVGFSPLLIFLGSFINRKAVWKLTRLDIICGVLSIFGIVLWYVTGSGNLAIIFAILADALAGVPTIVKAYKDPESENWHVFLGGVTSATITLLALDTWDFAHYGFPLYILLICALFVILIKFKIGPRRKLALDRLVKGEDERPLP